MLQSVKNVLKIIFFKLYLNLIGAVYLVKENVVRPRRLPDYSSQGEGRNYTLNISLHIYREGPPEQVSRFLWKDLWLK